MSNFYNYRQQTAAELQEKARLSAAKAGKKGQHYQPIEPQPRSRQLCKSWWGNAWCDNLESYSDYENRLPRGKRYVRAGAVIDLQVGKGFVKAKVQGSRRKPYSVTIRIDPLKESVKKEIEERCTFGIQSLEDLASGQFPEELKDLFTQKNGLFPSPRDIHFDCSCPDWASMCKHVAAVMYGIGLRLDENPFLFFELRDNDPQNLVQKAIDNKLESMLENADRPSKRILSGKTEELFGL